MVAFVAMWLTLEKELYFQSIESAFRSLCSTISLAEVCENDFTHSKSLDTFLAATPKFLHQQKSLKEKTMSFLLYIVQMYVAKLLLENSSSGYQPTSSTH